MLDDQPRDGVRFISGERVCATGDDVQRAAGKRGVELPADCQRADRIGVSPDQTGWGVDRRQRPGVVDALRCDHVAASGNSMAYSSRQS